MHSHRSQIHNSQTKNSENNRNVLNQKTSRYKTPPTKNQSQRKAENITNNYVNNGSKGITQKKIIKLAVNKTIEIVSRNIIEN